MGYAEFLAETGFRVTLPAKSDMLRVDSRTWRLA